MCTHEHAVAFYVQGYDVNEELGSSVGVVSGYGLDDRAIEVRSLEEARGYFL
jgi:hypothetical protein